METHPSPLPMKNSIEQESSSRGEEKVQSPMRRGLIAAPIALADLFGRKVEASIAAVFPDRPQNVDSRAEILLPVATRLGAHEVPTPGGTPLSKLSETMQGLNDTNMGTVVVIDGTRDWYIAAKNNNRSVIVRANLPGNRMTDENNNRLATQGGLVREVFPNPKVIPFNEQNVPDEISGFQPISPEQSVEDLINAANILTPMGIRVGITPYAQNSDTNSKSADIPYFKKVCQILHYKFSNEELENRFFWAFHAYAKTLDDNVNERISDLLKLQDGIFGKTLKMDIDITEVGFAPKLLQTATDAQLAQKAVTMLHQPLPDERITSYDWWLWGNFRFRPDVDKSDPTLQLFEKAALIKENGKSPVLTAMQEEMKKFQFPQQATVYQVS